MKRLLALATCVGCVVFISPVASSAARDLCVGAKPGCYATVQAAVDAANNGDTIRIAPGTFAGGVTIEVSVKLVGAGAGRTIINGGGPVLTIGTFGASSEPTVSIDAVTITGGVTRSSWAAQFVGDGVIALGGGVEIPPNANFDGGATVTITNSAITGNRVAPSVSVPSGLPCPGGDCPFALAAGGGIDSWGTVTLERTTVRDNRVGTSSGLSTLASDAVGGAITSRLAGLRISDSVVDGNQASATAPNGRFAEGGGIYAPGGTLRLSGSRVTDNSAVLEASLPDTVELLAQSGGIFIGSGPATIVGTRIADNTVAMTNSVGGATAFSGGLNVLQGDFRMINSVIADNEVSSAAIGSQGDAEGDTGGGALLGTVTNTRIIGNTVTVSSAGGDAFAAIGGSLQFGSLTNSVVSDNHLHATSPKGSASVLGAGVMVAEQTLTLRNTEVSRNTGAASGPDGFGRGGGIYDGPTPFDFQGSALVLVNSTVTGNSLSGGVGTTLQGGGLYVQNQPLTLTNSVIRGNSPDQCFGC